MLLYVGNVVEELYNILNSEPDKVNREMFYVGDAPIDLLDWTNAFSMELVGTPVRVVVPQRSIRSARPESGDDSGRNLRTDFGGGRLG